MPDGDGSASNQKLSQARIVKNTVTVSFFSSVIILTILEVLKLLDCEYMAFEGSEIPCVS